MSERQISPLTRKNVQYINHDFPLSVLIGHIYKDRRWMTPLWPVGKIENVVLPLDTNYHCHSHYEMIYVLEGVFTQRLENTSYCLNEGEATFLNNHICHADGDETECKCIYINFSHEFLNHLLKENALRTVEPQHHSEHILELCDKEDAALSDARSALDFRRSYSTENRTDGAIQCINALIAELQQKKTGYVFAVQSLLLKLFDILENPQNFHVTKVYANSSTESVLFADIEHYVQERQGRITREELASLLHYNPDYLGRVVKQQCGVSLLHYCQSVWIEKAKEMLRTSDMSVAEIMQVLDFENKNSFYRNFAAVVGMTPIEYRQKVRIGNKV